MSTLAYTDGGRRSNFTNTCNLLSQFLKDKRSCTKMESKATTTMDLLTNLQSSRQNASVLEFLPSFMENPCIDGSNLRSLASESPQLTIFYAGKVLVIDAFPPEKVTKVMELAANLASHHSGNNKNSPSATITPEILNNTKVPQTNTTQLTQTFGSNMRIPRRASLVKFLEKRKERVIAKRPYQINLDPLHPLHPLHQLERISTIHHLPSPSASSPSMARIFLHPLHRWRGSKLIPNEQSQTQGKQCRR